jgi:hypothetical protein
MNSREAVPDLAKHVALSELLYIAEGTALDDPKTAKFCINRIQQISRGDSVPFLLPANKYHEKLEKVMLMIKHTSGKVIEIGEAREMPSTPKTVTQTPTEIV